MKTILSIQSHVAYGYVGNRAAVFPLQLLGHEVVIINTVQFSNHTGYGSWTGEVFTPDHIAAIIAGLHERGVMDRLDAVLSGYLGDASLGKVVLDAVAQARGANPDLVYACDPVMGDVGRGFFVRPDIPDLFRENAAPTADILTPNQFELEALTGMTVQGYDDAIRACDILHERGTGTVLVTSLITPQTPAGTIEMLASNASGRYVVSTPVVSLTPAPNGAGDLTSALFLAHALDGKTLEEMLALTAASIHAVFEKTAALDRRELALVQSQEAIKNPPRVFMPRTL